MMINRKGDHSSRTGDHGSRLGSILEPLSPKNGTASSSLLLRPDASQMGEGYCTVKQNYSVFVLLIGGVMGIWASCLTAQLNPTYELMAAELWPCTANDLDIAPECIEYMRQNQLKVLDIATCAEQGCWLNDGSACVLPNTTDCVQSRKKLGTLVSVFTFFTALPLLLYNEISSYGNKGVLSVISLSILASSAFTFWSNGFGDILVARVFASVAKTVISTYTARFMVEFAPLSQRSLYYSLRSFFGTVGFVLAYMVSFGTSWSSYHELVITDTGYVNSLVLDEVGVYRWRIISLSFMLLPLIVVCIGVMVLDTESPVYHLRCSMSKTFTKEELLEIRGSFGPQCSADSKVDFPSWNQDTWDPDRVMGMTVDVVYSNMLARGSSDLCRAYATVRHINGRDNVDVEYSGVVRRFIRDKVVTNVGPRKFFTSFSYFKILFFATMPKFLSHAGGGEVFGQLLRELYVIMGISKDNATYFAMTGVFLSCIVTLVFMNLPWKFGRRIVLIVGSLLQIIAILIFSIPFWVARGTFIGSVVSVVGQNIFQVVSVPGSRIIGPLWTTEILPLTLINSGLGLSGAVALVATSMLLYFVNFANIDGMLALLTVVNCISLVFSVIFVKETVHLPFGKSPYLTEYDCINDENEHSDGLNIGTEVTVPITNVMKGFR